MSGQSRIPTHASASQRLTSVVNPTPASPTNPLRVINSAAAPAGANPTFQNLRTPATASTSMASASTATASNSRGRRASQEGRAEDPSAKRQPPVSLSEQVASLARQMDERLAGSNAAPNQNRNNSTATTSTTVSRAATTSTAATASTADADVIVTLGQARRDFTAGAQHLIRSENAVMAQMAQQKNTIAQLRAQITVNKTQSEIQVTDLQQQLAASKAQSKDQVKQLKEEVKSLRQQLAGMKDKMDEMDEMDEMDDVTAQLDDSKDIIRDQDALINRLILYPAMRQIAEAQMPDRLRQAQAQSRPAQQAQSRPAQPRSTQQSQPSSAEQFQAVLAEFVPQQQQQSRPAWPSAGNQFSRTTDKNK